MDDRKKSIDEFDKARQEARSSLDTLLENFGESLYVRVKDIDSVSGTDNFDDIFRYNALLQEIAETNTAIGKVEEKNRRFRELEVLIDGKEQEEKERSKELSNLYRKLGKALLSNNAYSDYTSLFSEQANALASKVESLESRINELEVKEGGNVFSWIGKSAQGLVLRSFLSKAQESHEQLFLNVGERYSYRDAVSSDDEVAVLRTDIEKIRAVSRTALDELSILKDEKRSISAGFGIDGNPQKQIQNLKNHIMQIKENLRSLYRMFGAQASGIMDAEIQGERKYFIDTIVSAEDGEIIGRAVKLNQSIIDYEKNIKKLRASLAIDDENTKIEKYRKSVMDKKNRIGDMERDIVDLEQSINESETRIAELKKQL